MLQMDPPALVPKHSPCRSADGPLSTPCSGAGLSGGNVRPEELQPSFLSILLSAVSAARPEQTEINACLFIEYLLSVYYGRFSGRPPP